MWSQPHTGREETLWSWLIGRVSHQAHIPSLSSILAPVQPSNQCTIGWRQAFPTKSGSHYRSRRDTSQQPRPFKLLCPSSQYMTGMTHMCVEARLGLGGGEGSIAVHSFLFIYIYLCGVCTHVCACMLGEVHA